jgi:hypothetical protein
MATHAPNPADAGTPATELIDARIAELGDWRGEVLARVQSAPLLHRLLWRVGIALPPPILAGFGTNALVQGLLFGLFWTALMWLMLWQGSERQLALLLVAGLLAGALFGVVMAALMRSLRRHRKLPDWRQFRARQAD